LLLAANNVVNAIIQSLLQPVAHLSGVRSTKYHQRENIVGGSIDRLGKPVDFKRSDGYSARGSGRLNGTSDLETSVLERHVAGGTLVEVYPVNQIIISGGGTKLQAQNNLTLAAGRSSDSALVNVADNYFAHARLDGFAVVGVSDRWYFGGSLCNSVQSGSIDSVRRYGPETS
jgi:hypothetical protein